MSEQATHPRIAPLEPPYEAEIDALLKKWMPPGAATEPLRLFRTLAVHDELASRMRPLGAPRCGAEANRCRSNHSAASRATVASAPGWVNR